MSHSHQDSQAYIAQLERELQIEAALERVRVGTMEMDASEQLAEVAALMFDNLLELFEISRTYMRCMIVITNEEEAVNRVWSTDSAGRSLSEFRVLPLVEHPVQVRIYEAWKKDKAGFIETAFEPAAAFKYSQYLAKLQGFDQDKELAEVLARFKENPALLPEQFYLNMAFFAYGRVGMITTEKLSEEYIGILKRFARVFEQTYTRFQDLQKAEALARETLQQTSLDRVRAEITSMRSAKDLNRIPPLIWRELTALGVPFFRCGVLIMREASRVIYSFLSTPAGAHLANLKIPYDNDTVSSELVEAWHNELVYAAQWDKQQFLDWSRGMLEKGHVGSPEEIPDFDDPPESLSLHFVPFKQGMLYVGSDEPLSEEHIKVVQSLADAFSVAYARYEDFQALAAKNKELARMVKHLENTQTQLIQSEKMASLGQLTAGIAHEIKNPLNFVNNFARLNQNLINDLEEQLGTAGDDVREMLSMLKLNESKIDEHGTRADRIVRSMMQHASGTSGERQQVALNAFVEEYVNLAVHGMRAHFVDFHVEIDRQYSEEVHGIELLPQEIGRVLVNIFNNAFDAMRERKAKEGEDYKPHLVVSTESCKDTVVIKIADNAFGMPEEVRAKIFEPFFTTKPVGAGTGLGLSLSYEIVTQGHGGRLGVESVVGEGTTFVITLPA